MCVASVVPDLTTAFREMAAAYLTFAPLIVGPGIKTGVSVATDNPREVGADRVMNALAAFSRFGGPTVVVDFGTSTNFDVVSAEGEFVGGVIGPGIQVAAASLVSRTARLPRVELVARMVGTVASPHSGSGQDHDVDHDDEDLDSYSDTALRRVWGDSTRRGRPSRGPVRAAGPPLQSAPTPVRPDGRQTAHRIREPVRDWACTDCRMSRARAGRRSRPRHGNPHFPSRPAADARLPMP